MQFALGIKFCGLPFLIMCVQALGVVFLIVESGPVLGMLYKFWIYL